MVGDEYLNESCLENSQVVGGAESASELERALVSAGREAQRTPVNLEPPPMSLAVLLEVLDVTLFFSEKRLEGIVSLGGVQILFSDFKSGPIVDSVKREAQRLSLGVEKE